MIGYRALAGFDLHARSVVAGASNAVTGEVSGARLTPDLEELWRWLEGAGGSRAAVAYGVRARVILLGPATRQRPRSS